MGVFQGTGPSALFLDGTADIESNYGWPIASLEPNPCGPAGTVFIDAIEGNRCGDVALDFNTGAGFDPSLAAGTYTVILSDAAYYPSAATGSANEELGDGFTDLTNGPGFTTCYNDSACIRDNGNRAIDIATGEGSSVTEFAPQPASATLAGLGFLAAGLGRADTSSKTDFVNNQHRMEGKKCS